MYSVQIVAQFKFVEWLIFWLLESEDFVFDWDTGNEIKSWIKHAISTEEAEEVFRSRLAVPLGIQVSPSANEERLGIIGPTSSGRLLHIVFTLRSGKVRPISSRLAKRKERVFYEKILREIIEGIR